MLRTAEELKIQAKLKGITRWPVHDCSMCGYPCGYIINGDRVAYDSGCDCVTYSNVQPRSWDDLAYAYNLNQPERNPDISQKYLEELNKIWQFEQGILPTERKAE